MSILALLAECNEQLANNEKAISSVGSSISAIDVINCKEFTPSQEAANGQETVEDADENPEKALLDLSISELHNKYTEADVSLAQLNKLWLIKGLLQEIKITFNPLDEPGYICDKYELESILANLVKLSGRLSELAEAHAEPLVIGASLADMMEEYKRQFRDQLVLCFEQFSPVSKESDEFVFHLEIDVNQTEFALEEFVKLVHGFEEFSNSSDLSDKFQGLKQHWQSHIVDKLFEKQNYITLDESSNHKTLTLSLVEAFPAPQFFNEYYIGSIRSFMEFINRINDSSFKHFYANKISNHLMNAVSENISKLFNNPDLVGSFVDLLELAKQTNWSLAIGRSFSTTDQVNEQLQNLYIDWITDRYINEFRVLFNSSELQTLLKSTTSVQASPPEDDWNKSWDEEPEAAEPKTNEEEDGWDDGWDDAWDEENKNEKETKTTKSAKPNVQMEVSKVPERVIAIFNKFTTEAGPNANNALLVSTVLSLSLISYPALTESLLLHNDLKKIGMELAIPEFGSFAETSWNQQGIVYSNEIFKLLLSLHLDDDDGLTVEIEQLEEWFRKLQKTRFRETNSELYKALVVQTIELVNSWTISLVLGLLEISEGYSDKMSTFIGKIQRLAEDLLQKVDEPSSVVLSSNKLSQTVFLLNNHLKDIMEYFYQGELFDYETAELIHVIESIFIKSDLRDNYIREIVDIRSVDS